MTTLPPTDVRPHVELLDEAHAALTEGHPETTLELVREILELVPNDADAMFLEAEALRDLRDAPAAESGYRRLLQIDGSHSDVWSGLGSALFDQGAFDEAARCFSRALRLREDNADALYGRAMLRERLGDGRGAKRDYLRAWRLSPRFPLPQALSALEIRNLLREAASRADEATEAWLGPAQVIVLDHPGPETCEAYEPPASPAELLGHVPLGLTHPGTPFTAWTSFTPPVLLFRRNLERYAHDRDQLVMALRHGVVEQVRTWLEETTPTNH